LILTHCYFAGLVSTVDRCIDLDTQELGAGRRIGHDFDTGDHPAGDTDGVSAHGEAHAKDVLLQQVTSKKFTVQIARRYKLEPSDQKTSSA